MNMRISLPAGAAAMAVLAAGAPAQAQPYGYYEFPGDPYARGGYAAPVAYDYYGSRHRYRYGPADPCAREAGNRALGWGLVGLVLGGLAGGAAAGAGVVAEGAGLGGLVGAVTGASAGSASAACGTARYSGLPVRAVTSSGVAIYGRPMYDYEAAYEQRAPRHPGHRYEGRYDDGYHAGPYAGRTERSYSYSHRDSEYEERAYRDRDSGYEHETYRDHHGGYEPPPEHDYPDRPYRTPRN